jgi:hypothetical protein
MAVSASKIPTQPPSLTGEIFRGARAVGAAAVESGDSGIGFSRVNENNSSAEIIPFHAIGEIEKLTFSGAAFSPLHRRTGTL